MAGITNVAFRRLCREQGGGVYVCEMITTRALVERIPKTLKMIAFAATRTSAACSCTAWTRRDRRRRPDGRRGGPGRPHRPQLRLPGAQGDPARRRLGAAVAAQALRPHRAAGGRGGRPAGIPVTVKMRKGIDDDHLTYVEAGLIAQEAGVAAVALHARTAEQRYSGTADWDAIATLKQALDVPVLGNGDIWEASDAMRMVEHTGVDGVVVGRGCLGRPWLFADLQAAFAGRPSQALPTLGEVAAIMSGTRTCWSTRWRTRRHGCADFRKHVAWYLKGFPVGGDLRRSLAMVSSLAELDDCSAAGHGRAVPAGVAGPAARPDQRPGKVSCRTAGWTAATTTPSRRCRDGQQRRLAPFPDGAAPARRARTGAVGRHRR
jgi:tRNA-dihydrouridine synthase